ncbi:MAG TPA: thioredoxin domain-containing protein [Longimicrobiales bacterium]
MKERDRLASAGTVVLAVCALVITGLVVRRELYTPPARVAVPRLLDDWSELTARGHWLGPPDARVKIVEFSDFQCPFCAQIQPVLRELREKYSDEVAIVYRHLPLESIHPFAYSAALAAECAAAQARFERFKDALFENQALIGTVPYDSIARLAGVADLARFRDCVESEEFAGNVDADVETARAAGLTGTPSIIIGGYLLPGTPSFAELEAWTQAVLAGRGDEPLARPDDR